MKKVLALVLAAAMLATVAFAAVPDWNPGEEIGFSSTAVGTANDLNTKNYSIKKIEYKAGKALVDSVKLDNEEGNELKVVLKDDYTMTKVKNLEMTITLRGLTKDDRKDYTLPVIKGDVFWETRDLAIDNNGDVDKPDADALDGKVISKVKSDADGKPYGTLDFSVTDSSADVSVRVYDGDKFFLGHNFDADKKVLIANADTDATISFLNFDGKPSFNSTATVYFYDVDEKGFIYELTGEGKIKKSAAKWSDDDNAWVLKTRTLGSYVFSDKALASAADATDSTTNPDTGANDVVGIATALAVVSLVAAGAVSLKK